LQQYRRGRFQNVKKISVWVCEAVNAEGGFVSEFVLEWRCTLYSHILKKRKMGQVES
jgi:hypothetical protein